MASPKQIRLEFNPKLFPELHEDDLRKGLSAAATTGSNLWLISDAAQTIERLTEVEPGQFSHHISLPLKNYLQVPDPSAGEYDLEGLDVGAGYLWICGSHGLSRQKPNPKFQKVDLELQHLRKIKRSPNRFLLARIPIVPTHDGPDWVLTQENGRAQAGCLRGEDGRNELIDALREDPMLAPYLDLPDKDNGLNIEGLAVHGEKIYLGLRGPVLQGWALVLKLEVADCGPGVFRLKKRGSRRFTKHFLSCDGLGFRDLKFDGEDLLLIAGPTMTLNGEIKLYRWKGAARVNEDSIHRADTLQCLGPLPRTAGSEEEKDRAEGLTLLNTNEGKNEYLLLYDRPAPWRVRGKRHYRADLLEIGDHCAEIL